MKKRAVTILLITILVAMLIPGLALAASSGFNDAAGHNDNSYVGNPEGAYGSGSAVFNTHQDRVDYTFGNVVPEGVSISGIEVKVKTKKDWTILGWDRDLHISLIVSGSAVGTKINDPGTSWNNSTLGSDSDKWGYGSWTADKINSLEVRVATPGTSIVNSYLDHIQLKVTYTQNTTTTTVASNANPSTYGQDVTFTATVSPSGATGTVQFKIDGSNAGDPVTVSGGTATLTRSNLAVGTHTVTAEYSGSSSYQASTGTLSGGQIVNKAATTTALTSSANPSTFGQNVTFTATVSPSGATGTVQFKIDGTNYGSPVAVSGGTASISKSDLSVGNHTVTAVYSGNGSYNGSTGTLSGGQTVNKAASTTALTSSDNPSSIGQLVTFTATVGPGGATGTVQFKIDGSNVGAPVAIAGGTATLTTSSLSVGNHSVTAEYSGNTSYNGSTGTLAGGQTVNKLNTTTAVVSSDNTTTYGDSVTFTATVSPGAATGTVVFKVDGATIGSAAVSGGTATFTTSSIPAGSHTITAQYSGDATYEASSGTCSQAVAKADADIDVDGVTVTYDGAAHGATGTATGADGSDLTSLLDLGSSFTNVPGGTANWSFAGDANHNAASGSVEIVINKADADIDVDGVTVTYDGLAHGATGTATGADGSDLSSLLNLGSSFTNVPGGTAYWSFLGDANHNADSGSVEIIINKADAVISVLGTTVTYDGTAYGATGTATGADGSDLTSLLDLGSSFTDVPGGTADWSFAGDDNHNADSGSVQIIINKADAVISVLGTTVTYDGTAYGATGTATGADGSDLTSLLDLGSSFVNVPGGTADWSFAGDTNHNADSGSVEIVINKADATISVLGTTVAYDGTAHGATGTATGADGADLSALIDLGSSFVNVPGGTADWSFAGDTNHNAASGSVEIIINKADAVIDVDGVTVTYDGSAHGAAGTATGADGTDLSPLLTLGSSFTNVPGGTADWSFAGDANHNPASGSVNIIINKAPLTVTAENKAVTFLDAPPAYTAVLSGFVTGEDIGDLAGTLALDCEYAAGDAAGTYAITPSGLTSGNYEITFKPGTLTVNILYLTVTFRDYDGDLLGTDTVAYGTAADAPASPTRTGYRFTGWNRDFDNVTADMTVTARYAIRTYTVSFVDFDGTVIDTQRVDWRDGAAEPAAPEREGYTFTGWDVEFDPITSNLTVTAQYTINTYTVTFADFDGTVIATQTVDWNTAATAPADPTREGYTFTGWNTEFDAVTSNITVTAQYQEVEVIDNETIPGTDDDTTTINDDVVPQAGPAGFAWWWIVVAVLGAGLLFFLIFFVWRRRRPEEEQK